MGLGWKVPFRQVYATTFRGWLLEMVWCHIVLRLFPDARLATPDERVTLPEMHGDPPQSQDRPRTEMDTWN